MNKKQFDKIIADNVIRAEGAEVLGYETYTDYYTADCFKNFVEGMKKYNCGQYLKQYGGEKGREMIPKKGRYGMVPPKMASVASSSRFCYLALRDGGAAFGSLLGSVQFEYECEIKGVSRPQLDAFISDKKIYIEAKCHEIFDNHKIKFAKAYWNLVYGENNDFGFEAKTETDATNFEIPASVFGIDGEKSPMLDIKQFLCHIMGIASSKNEDEEATLVYMFFKPKTDDSVTNSMIEDVFSNLATEVKAVFESKPIQNFTKKNKIKLRAVAEYSERMEALTKENIVELV